MVSHSCLATMSNAPNKRPSEKDCKAPEIFTACIAHTEACLQSVRGFAAQVQVNDLNAKELMKRMGCQIQRTAAIPSPVRPAVEASGGQNQEEQARLQMCVPKGPLAEFVCRTVTAQPPDLATPLTQSERSSSSRCQSFFHRATSG